MTKMQTLKALADSDMPHRLQAITDYQVLTESLRETVGTLDDLKVLIEQAGICLSRELSEAKTAGRSLEESLATLEDFPEALAGRLGDIEGLVEGLARQIEAASEANRSRAVQQIQDLLAIQRNSLVEYGQSLAATARESIAAPLASLTAAAGEARKAQASLKDQVAILETVVQALDTLPERMQTEADRLGQVANKIAKKEIPQFLDLMLAMFMSSLVVVALQVGAVLFLTKTGVIDLKSQQVQAQEQPVQLAPSADSPIQKSAKRGK